MLFLNFLVGIAIALVALVNAAPVSEDVLERITLQDRNMSDPDRVNTLGYDPSFDYHEYSMVQAWMGKDKTTVGSLTGNELFIKVKKALEESCPATNGAGHCAIYGTNPKGELRSSCEKSGGGVISCVTTIFSISSRWQSIALRIALIDAVAGFLGAVTTQGTTGANCWELPHTNGVKACNVGDVVRINLPTLKYFDDGQNYMHIRLSNYWTGAGPYDCCEGDGLKQMDGVLDALEVTIRNELKSNQQDWFRDSRCIIDGWKTCPLSAGA